MPTPYKTRLLRLVALNTALALIVALGWALDAGRGAAPMLPIELAPEPSAVRAISIGAGDGLIELVKRDGLWSLKDEYGEVPADAQRVEAFLSALNGVKRVERMARSAASFPALGLDDAARRVRLADFSDRTLAEFFVGDYGPSSDFAYARLAGAAEAWAMPAAAAGYVYASRLSWQDLRVLPAGIAAQDVQELKAEGYLELEAGGRAPLGYALRREGTSWVAAGATIDAAKVDAMLRSLLGLRAASYGPPADGGSAGTARVVLTLGDGRSFTLSVVERLADGRYRAGSSARARPFVIPGGTALDAFKPLDQLRP